MKSKLQYRTEGCITTASTSLLRLGTETRPTHAEGWSGEQITGSQPALAFSLLPVHVAFANDAPVVLSPATVAMPSTELHYDRAPASPRGQRTVFLCISKDVLCQSIARRDPAAIDRPDNPYPERHAPACPRASAMARQLERLVFHTSLPSDPLFVEEYAMHIINRSIDTVYDSILPTRRVPRSEPTRRTQRNSINRVTALLCADPSHPWSLNELADHVELSPGYLCRIFHAHTGHTITRYRTIIRVMHALERLADERGNLTQLALACGFSSHAHMTSIFTKLLGATPSALARSTPRGITESLRRLNRLTQNLNGQQRRL